MVARRRVLWRLGRRGFTIVELMIATLVFSVILLIITFAIIQIGRTYTKGITESKTQQTARAITDAISQDIQFNSGTVVLPGVVPPTGPYAYCVGDNRYTINRSHQLATSGSDHGLILDKMASCNPTPIPGISGGALIGTPPFRELLSPNMRIADLTITQAPGTTLFTIHLHLVYGDDDLLCSPSLNDCNGNGLTTLTKNDLACKAKAGNQYCAVSDLMTTVQKRKS